MLASSNLTIEIAPGRTGWRYEYEPDELEELPAMLPRNKNSYVFFNNIRMTEDAVKFQEIVKSQFKDAAD